MKILIILLFSIIFISCTSTDKNILQNIKNWEYSRNPDTTYFSGLLFSSDNSLKVEIIQSIGRMGQEPFLPLLENLLKTKDPSIIKNTIFAIGQIGTPQCEKLLTKMFNQTKYEVYKKDILLALGQCADQYGTSLLLKNLNSLPDSLKSLTIQNLAFIYKRNSKLKAIPDTIQNRRIVYR